MDWNNLQETATASRRPGRRYWSSTRRCLCVTLYFTVSSLGGREGVGAAVRRESLDSTFNKNWRETQGRGAKGKGGEVKGLQEAKPREGKELKAKGVVFKFSRSIHRVQMRREGEEICISHDVEPQGAGCLRSLPATLSLPFPWRCLQAWYFAWLAEFPPSPLPSWRALPYDTIDSPDAASASGLSWIHV